MSNGLIRILTALIVLALFACVTAFGQNNDRLTPLQRRIEQQKQRLSSGEVEERRDALMKLGAMQHPDASRAAMTALNDEDPMVRVAAAHALASMPPAEAATVIVPLLQDKLEFVRREAAYSLGETRSRTAVQPLIDLLQTEKQAAVRAAAVIALGQIGDQSAVPALAQALSGFSVNKKSKKREDQFVMRSAARALGQIGSQAGVEPLISALTDEANSIHIRRAAAEALGLIGNPSAIPALEAASESNDPYLSEAARAALRRVKLAKK
jgi:HEAT repeat protein